MIEMQTFFIKIEGVQLFLVGVQFLLQSAC